MVCGAGVARFAPRWRWGEEGKSGNRREEEEEAVRPWLPAARRLEEAAAGVGQEADTMLEFLIH